MERFTGFNIHSFNPMKFLQEYFCGALASSAYYLTIAKYSWVNFHGTLTNCENNESLAQQIFPRWRFIALCFYISDFGLMDFLYNTGLLPCYL